MLAAYLVIPLNTSEVYGVPYNLQGPLANGKQELIPEEMSSTLLTNKNQGTGLNTHAANTNKPTQPRINREKYTFSAIKGLEHIKNFKNGPVLYLGLRLESKAKSISWDSPFKYYYYMCNI